MRTEIKLDWLQYTIPVSTAEGTPRTPFWLVDTSTAESITPRNGYAKAYRCTHTGVAVMWHPYRVDMGVMVMATGKALEQLRRDGISDRALLRHVVAQGAHCTRIDVALDIYDDPRCTPHTAEQARQQSRIITRYKGHFFGAGESAHGLPGSTLYIGQRASKSGFVRIYDKAAERGVPDKLWTRLEAVFKSRKADSVVRTAAQAEDAQAALLSLIKGAIDINWEGWREALATTPMKAKDTRAESDWQSRYTWLMESVAPALAEMESQKPGIAQEFHELVAELTTGLESAMLASKHR